MKVANPVANPVPTPLPFVATPREIGYRGRVRELTLEFPASFSRFQAADSQPAGGADGGEFVDFPGQAGNAKVDGTVRRKRLRRIHRV